MRRMLFTGAVVASAGVVLFASPAGAQEAEELAEQVGHLDVLQDNLFVLLAGVLVFFMQAGFSMLEAGMTRAKNAANIMMKNLADMSAGVLAFFVVGWSIAYDGAEWLGGWMGAFGFGVSDIDSTLPLADGLYPSTDFFFQAAFAATAATIVAGTMAERTKFRGYVIFSVAMTAFIYPVVLRWTWGGGWLGQREYPFSDFAGSTIVHSTGGWAALMGAIIVGPRLGRYAKDGRARAIPGHSMVLMGLGVMILFIGWFGFNPGSELAMADVVPSLAVKTLLSALAGAVTASGLVWILDGKPEFSMGANGLLAGLVSITAPVGTVETWVAIVVGGVGGLIVVLSVKMFDRLQVDDPVGAISVHGVCGVWGTLSIGLLAWQPDGFMNETPGGELVSQGLLYSGEVNQLFTQVTMIVAHAIFVCIAAGLVFLAIKYTVGLRATEEEELAGLDVSEHGAPGYGPDLLNGGGASVPPSELIGTTRGEPVMSGGSLT